MNFQQTVSPINKSVPKVLLISIAIIAIALGAAVFSFAYSLVAYEPGPAIYGMVMVWIGSIAFFYGVITEEHTLKELFLRQAYFFTGILVMIIGLFFVSLAGFAPSGDIQVLEFGLMLLLLGAALVILSAQRTYDYSRASAFFALFSGILMMLGGVMAGSMNAAYAGVFVIIFGAVWLGLRDGYAQ